MATKLTLSINEQVIQKAKLVSRRKGKSLSKMVEEYLQHISEQEEGKESPIDNMNKVISDNHKRRSKIKSIPEDIDYKAEWHVHLDEKYGKKSQKK